MRIKNISFTAALFLSVVVFFCFVGNTVSAEQAKKVGDKNALKDIYTVKLVNPIGGTEDNTVGQVDIRVILGKIVYTAMGMLGAVVLIVFVFGGFEWLTAAGNDEKIKKGTGAMMWAVVGLFLIFGSYGIISLVIEGLGATKDAPPPWGMTSYGYKAPEVLDKSLCEPRAEFNLKTECEMGEEKGKTCKDINEAYSSDVCKEEKDGKCVPAITEKEYCKQWDGNASECEMQSACEATNL